MATLWFVIVALMLTAYVLLDGFDIGAGIVHLFVARAEDERRAVIRSIGPVWDGNEVFLLAAGGTLYFAFPLLYASSFSGFYLPLMMVLWLLMLRACGIELRNHVQNPLWKRFFDGTFFLASALLAIFYGAALGNVIRGVPLDADGYFFNPLFTDFRVGPKPGILDWYTVLAGLVALVSLTIHGSLYVAIKTNGNVRQRAYRVVTAAWPVLFALSVISLAATIWVRPTLLDNYQRFPVAYLIPLVVFGSQLMLLLYLRVHHEKKAFIASGVYLAFMLIGAVFGLYPIVLPSSSNAALNLTIQNSAAPEYGLKIGLVWWTIGMALATAYFVFIYRMFRGKVVLESDEGHGY